MLVALLMANPDAFIGGNVNRIRAGAVSTCRAPPRPARCRPRKPAARSRPRAATSAPIASGWPRTPRPRTSPPLAPKKESFG
ncbi:hypothetical protein ACEN8K_45205, partial [Variovorax sp. CT11-76]